MTAEPIPIDAWCREHMAPDRDDRPTPPLEAYEADIERELNGPACQPKKRAGGYIHPEAGRREAELKAALRPLATIEPVLDRNYLVKGWLDQGAASVVYGPSGVGKTFLALDLTLHVAAGADWHGHRVE